MLKITVQDGTGAPTLQLDGKLAGDWVSEVERVWKSFAAGQPAPDVTLDLSGVTFVDAGGKKLLSSMLERGVKLEDPRLLVKYIVDEIKSGRTV